jgi:hypothetical protein
VALEEGKAARRLPLFARHDGARYGVAIAVKAMPTTAQRQDD